ncbi:MAG: hypothetical protein ACMG5Z_02040 [Luteimonas sp.]
MATWLSTPELRGSAAVAIDEWAPALCDAVCDTAFPTTQVHARKMVVERVLRRMDVTPALLDWHGEAHQVTGITQIRGAIGLR